MHGQKFVTTWMFCGEQQGKAEEAVNFYVSLFQNTKIEGIMKYPEGEVAGQVVHAQFKLNDIAFAAMDSGVPQPFTFSEGISQVIECDTQEEIDHYWDAFAKGGKESMCGWVQDKFGVSWQVVPSILGELMSDPANAIKASEACMKMKKFDIADLKKATE
ncbi:VOC family protein [Olivibacter sitiensis]|uniref:VOC family protein n=1 Tax=Olivibacter sitiensis TaxID=376470 RepID=UPI003CCBA406